jgi:hypothetical protein
LFVKQTILYYGAAAISVNAVLKNVSPGSPKGAGKLSRDCVKQLIYRGNFRGQVSATAAVAAARTVLRVLGEKLADFGFEARNVYQERVMAFE